MKNNTAEVVELADALGSGPSESNLVGVQFPPSALPVMKKFLQEAVKMQSKEKVINVLSQDVVEKIAAGEVIERPSSVLKELIENSIDAEADKINIIIENSGFSLIKVCDNGIGMNLDNLKKCFLRHATSKIKYVNDLYSITTFGFRGEALASIGAISRTTIISSCSDDGQGYSIDCEGGTISLPKPEAHLRGTTVICKDLFYNVPARKKFQKTPKAERVALIKLLEQLFIPFPSVHFIAVFEGKEIFNLSPTDSLLNRICQITGNEFAKSLKMACGNIKGIDATIYYATQEDETSKPRYQNLYVNLRRVDNDSVLFAIRQAFLQLIGKNVKPSFFCFLSVDPSIIDVNVHPAKQKVKFENEKEIFSLIYKIVSNSIRNSVTLNNNDVFNKEQGSFESVSFKDFYKNEKDSESFIKTVLEEPSNKNDYEQTIIEFPKKSLVHNLTLETQSKDDVKFNNREESMAWDHIPCYQIHEMYILAPIKNGILLIDQHAAHEKILYEQALLGIETNSIASQQLLFPVVFTVNETEMTILETSKEYFKKFGFEIEDFGGKEVAVSAAPSFIPAGEIERSVREMIAYLLDEKSVYQFPDVHKRFAAAFACGSAIKSGQKLSQEEMVALLNRLFLLENPYTCPHGRPTIVRLSLEEISRRFLR